MYVFVQFCAYCSVNPHIEMNSAMNPIIYTVFNRGISLINLLEKYLTRILV
ncbi:unnamed protein product [Meloidogyne enterolobii]|uniref:Uncharacterized protein n=1 Tax=Meloidogyne enterolobii TaxID=390850 RepID=A0ACB0Z3T5_MELEN